MRACKYCTYKRSYETYKRDMKALIIECRLWRQDGSDHKTASMRLGRICEILGVVPMHEEDEDEDG